MLAKIEEILKFYVMENGVHPLASGVARVVGREKQGNLDWRDFCRRKRQRTCPFLAAKVPYITRTKPRRLARQLRAVGITTPEIRS